MRAENLISEPIKTTYKYGVYGTVGFAGLFLVGFIAWSFTCLGSAAWQLVSGMA